MNKTFQTFQTLSAIPALALLALFALLALSAAPCAASEPISGAFGYLLGEPFNTSSVPGVAVNKFGLLDCEVEPRQGAEMFEYYHLDVTPVSKRIAQISGIACYQSATEFRDNLRELLAFLQSKYGQASQDKGGYLISQEKKSIYVFTTENTMAPEYTLTVLYTDDELYETGSKEQTAKQ